MTPYDQLPKLLRRKQVMELTGWGAKVLRSLVRSGRLRAWRTVRGQCMYYKADVFSELNGVNKQS